MFKKILLGAIVAAAIAAGIVYLWNSEKQPLEIPQQVGGEEQLVGASIPTVVSLFETSLQSSISESATSMTLVSGTDRSGTSLSGFMCFTIDEGTSSAEFVCGTASGTSVTGITRGVSPTTGTSTVTSLRYSHRRGASVKITNYPQLAVVSRILNGNETLPNLLVYDASVSTTTQAANTAALANVAYVNGVALQGAPTATGTTPGVIQLATRAQLSSGTAMSGVYTLVPPNSFFSYTPQAATSVPVSNASGKLAQGWLDLTQAFTWSGLQTFNSATTTLNATTSIAASSSNRLLLNGVSYAFPSSQASASTTLINDGAGNIIWDVPVTTPNTGTYSTSSPVSGLLRIAHNLGRVPKFVKVTAMTGTSGGSCGTATSIGTYNGSITSTVAYKVLGACGSSGAVTDTSNLINITPASTLSFVATSTVDSTYLNFGVTVTGAMTAVVFTWEAY